jgi:WD40 repeat protein
VQPGAAEGKQMWVSPLPAGADGPYALSLAPSGKELAVGGRSGSVRILDAATGRELRRVNTPDSMLFAMTYSPDGKLIAALGGNCTVFLWDAETGKLKGEFVGYDGSGGSAGTALRFSPDGTQLVAPVRRGPGGGGALDFNGKLISKKFDPNAGPGSDPDEKCRLALWDVKTGKRLRILGKPTPHGVNEAVFDLDGATLAARDYNDVCVIDAATGNELRRFPAAWGSLAFTPDDKLWIGHVCHDPATGKKVAEVAGGPHALVALSDDGRVLVTAQGGSNTALVWYRPER